MSDSTTRVGTLADWCERNNVFTVPTEHGKVIIPSLRDDLARWQLHHLADYVVSSVSGPVVRLVPRPETKKVEPTGRRWVAVWGNARTGRCAGVLDTFDSRVEAAVEVRRYLSGEDNSAVGAWVCEENDDGDYDC